MWCSHSLQKRWRTCLSNKARIDTDGMSHHGEYMTYILYTFCTLISPYIPHRCHQCPRGTDETNPHSKTLLHHHRLPRFHHMSLYQISVEETEMTPTTSSTAAVYRTVHFQHSPPSQQRCLDKQPAHAFCRPGTLYIGRRSPTVSTQD